MIFTIDQIQQATGARLLQRGVRSSVSSVTIDSRVVAKHALFIAIKGESKDGHAFIADAVTQGAQALLISHDARQYAPGISVLLVPDTTVALGQLAAFHRRRFTLPVIAVTGTAGKTSTKEMISSVLSARYTVLKNERSFNNQFGVPLTLLKLRPKYTAAVIEVGVSRKGDMAYLAKFVQPTIAVFTNIGYSHLEGLGTRGGVLREKMRLLRYLDGQGCVIVNTDDAYLQRWAATTSVRTMRYGINTGSVRARQIHIDGTAGTRFVVKKQAFRLPGIGQHHVYNALAAVCCGQLLNIPNAAIARQVAKKITGCAGRQQICQSGGVTIINDTYNANPISFQSAIATFDVFSTKGKKIVVCADMRELGAQSVDLHRKLGVLLAASTADVVCAFGPSAKDVICGLSQAGFRGAVFHYEDRDALHATLKDLLHIGDVILVKGSHSMHMEKTVTFITDMGTSH